MIDASNARALLLVLGLGQYCDKWHKAAQDEKKCAARKAWWDS